MSGLPLCDLLFFCFAWEISVGQRPSILDVPFVILHAWISRDLPGSEVPV